MAKITDIGRWRTEIQLAEKFRNEDFGRYTNDQRSGAGENIDYFEQGFSSGFTTQSVGNASSAESEGTATLNLFHVVTKLIVPSLYFQNPKVTVQPKRKVDQDSAPLAKGIVNYFYKEMRADEENELTVWDGYVLNKGITKVGYATKFGMDIGDPSIKKKKPVDRLLETIGLKKKKEEPLVKPEVNQKIVAESPYVKWVSPFRFLKDPRSRTLDEAMWCAEEFDKTVSELKKNKKYKNTGNLVGTQPDLPRKSNINIAETQIEEFSVVRVYQIEYRNDNQYYMLVIAKDGETFKELYHEERIYEMDGFQYDELEFNKHGHLQYKRSDLTKIKNIQDRITSVFDAILDQYDRFLAKVAVDSTAVSPKGMTALESGDIGAIIECNKSPKEAIQEIGLTQFKTDLKSLMEELVKIITIMTGVTQSKLLGISTGRTATGETIAQGGENIRLADMGKSVSSVMNKQATKLWQVIKQFVPLEELQIITGESGIDPETGNPIYTWLPDVDSEMSQKLAEGQYRFDLEVASTQKVDSELIGKRIENLINILSNPNVIAIMQQQGKRVDVAEVLRIWLRNNPEIVRDESRIIQDINDNTKGLVDDQSILGGPGGQTQGSQTNELRAQRSEPAPTQVQ